jgi:hypothetical protein
MSWNSVFWVFLKVDVESVFLDCLGTHNDATVTSCSLRDSNYQEQRHFRLPPTCCTCSVTYRHAYVSMEGERNASSLLLFLGIDVWFHWFNNVFLCIFGHNGLHLLYWKPPIWPLTLVPSPSAPPPFCRDSYVANKSYFSIVRTNDSKSSTRLYFADFLQKDFSSGADHFVSITESRQEGWRPKTKVENLTTFHPATRIRRIFHIL